MNRPRVWLGALALTCFMSGQASAAAIVFDGPLATTLPTFLAQTGAANVVGGDFPNIGLVADGVLDGSGEPYTGAADISFLPPSTALFSGTAGLSISEWSTVLSGPDLALSAQEHLVVTMPGAVYSMGFEFVEPSIAGTPPDTCNAPCFDSTYQVRLYNGAVPVHNFLFNAADDQAWFIGVWTDFAFTRMEIQEIVGNIDNEYFNRVYAGTNPVPEPTSMLLLGTGLAGMMARRYRSKRS